MRLLEFSGQRAHRRRDELHLVLRMSVQPLVDALVKIRQRIRGQLAVKRPEGLPEYRVIDMAKDKWRDVRHTLTMDGKLDETFWTAYYHPRALRDFRSGSKAKQQTRFMATRRQANQHSSLHR